MLLCFFLRAEESKKFSLLMKKGYIYEPRIGNRLFSRIIYFLEEVVKGDLLPLQIGI